MVTLPTLAMRLTLIVVITGFWFFTNWEQSNACSCAPPGSPSEALTESATVFQGKVVLVQELVRQDGLLSSMDPTTVEFEVSAVWKGPAHEIMHLTTPRFGASCGFTFVEGDDYVVYSRDGSTVGLCSRTASVSNAQADLDDLGEGRAPGAGTVAPTPDVSENGSGGGCGLSSNSSDTSWLMSMAGLVWFGLRRRPQQA